MHDFYEGLKLGWQLDDADTDRLHLMTDALMRYLKGQVKRNHVHTDVIKAYKTRYYRVRLQDFGSGKFWGIYWHPTMYRWRKA